MSSFGEDIRRERELRRITLREVAESTKITLRYLEALEKNEFDDLPGGVFNRGFVRAYAEYIGIDPEATVTAYLLQVQTGSQAEGESQQPDEGPLLRGNRVRGNAISQTVPPRDRNPRWSRWALILIALTILYFGGRYLFQRMSDSAELPAPTSIDPNTTDSAELSTTPPPVTNADGSPTPAESKPPASTPEASTAVVEPAPAVKTESTPTVDNPTTALDPVSAIIHIDRATSGRVNCDNLQIETLDGTQGGTQLRLNCSRFLIIDVSDAGALRLALGGRPARPLGNDGESLAGYRVNFGTRDPDSSAAQQ
jgi:cytoskeletal protein RodZ